MKLVIRADDYGYTVPYNMGALKTIEEGITTHVDIMLDTPGTVDALETIKNYPWISVGWHDHFWGAPVSDPKLIPSMVNEEGRFKFRKDQSLKNECVFEEVLLECRAQIERCIRILGRAPDVALIHGGSPFELAKKQVCDEYGIKYNFMYKYDTHSSKESYPLEEFEHLNITMATQHSTAYKPQESTDWNDRKNYDPIQYFLDDEDGILKQEISISAWHPGYLDDYIVTESSYKEARPIDIAALCSPILKQWIVDNQVELINLRDALYGTNEYQNHLKVIHSPLAIQK